MHVHPVFWQELACAVGLPGSNISDQETLSRWVSVVLATAPSPAPDSVLQYLAERCVEREAVDSLIAIFEHVTTVTLRFSPFSTGLYGDAESEPVPTIHPELDAASDDYAHTAAYVWTNALRPNLGQIAGRMIAYSVANVEAQHRTLWRPQEETVTWGDASRLGGTPRVTGIL